MTKNNLSIMPVCGKANLMSLWIEADKLGTISLEQDYAGRIVEAKIRFKLLSGSQIWACGVHIDPAIALGKAIDEARHLKGNN